MIKITHANVVTDNDVLINHDVIIKDDNIFSIQPSSIDEAFIGDIIDAKNGYLMPGFIDIHSDYIEHIASPRTKIILSLDNALHEFEKECMVHGITTMYHSVSLWNGTGSKPLRNKDHIMRFAEIIKHNHYESHLIHNRLHLRYEIDNLDQIDVLKQLITSKQCHLLSFMDHTPGQGQYHDIEQYKKYIQSITNYPDEKINQLVEASINSPKLSYETQKEIADLATQFGIPIASHDDDTEDKLDRMKRLNTSISEFPITLDVAKHAKKIGLYTLVGAPNILLGSSSTGNLSAIEAIDHDAADIICSDYFPPALLHSVFKLYKMGYPLPQVVNKLSLNPAKALFIDDIKGSIEVGKMADLIIVDASDIHQPRIQDVFVSGKKVISFSYRGQNQ